MSGRIYNDITEIFGNTPLVRLNKVAAGLGATVLAKLEFYNPSASIKDRLGIAIVDAAEASGALKPGGTFSTTSSFGKSTQAFDPRKLQLSLTFAF